MTTEKIEFINGTSWEDCEGNEYMKATNGVSYRLIYGQDEDGFVVLVDYVEVEGD